MVTADFDGDGLLEVAVAGRSSTSVHDGEVRIFETTGDLRQVWVGSGVGLTLEFGETLATGDLDGDVYADVVVADPAQDNTGAIYVMNNPLECP
jgi:hypothetical protein